MSVSTQAQIPTSFSYGTPAEVVFGNGTSRTVGERAAAWGARHVLFVADKGVRDAGLSGPAEDSLRRAGVAWETFDGVTGEPTDRSVQAAVDMVDRLRPDALVAMGGGSAMDTAKAAAAVAANGGTVLEYLNRQRKLSQPGVPVVAIPTTSGTGAEVTPISVIIDVDRHYKGGASGPLLMPRLAICDPELTLRLPSMVTANSGIDALTHCVECYANTTFNPYAKLLALEGVRVIGRSLRQAVVHGGDLAARWQMMWGANLGGLCIAKAGTGDVHAFAGPISGMFGVPHGRANAILLPRVMAFSLPGALDAYVAIAEALGEPVKGLSRVTAAERAVTAVERLITDCGGPLHLSDCGIREEHLEALTRDGFARGNRATNPRIATREDVYAIYRAAL
ncbi:MAG TPA: iron-containing alcohol dehydrogenase [Chloroflexota bacterium]|nr:iron-containing alcohol dehydrogenase [Chloroflexota bacterium]